MLQDNRVVMDTQTRRVPANAAAHACFVVPKLDFLIRGTMRLIQWRL